jgi:muramoyltetrapeptide carboxypeptidase
VSDRTAGGLVKFRPVRPGSRVALVAPASPFGRIEFDAGVAELRTLGLEPVYDQSVFARDGFVAGSAQSRATALLSAMGREDIAAVVAVRGGYGSVELLSLLDATAARATRTAFIGYSDVTSVHAWLGCHVGMASVHGPMIDGRLSKGPTRYDRESFLASLTAEPMGELAPEGVQVINRGEAAGPLFGGTLTQLLASLGTPFEFRPPNGHVLFIDEVAERPYRLRRMLTQLRLSGLLAAASAVVFGQLPRCDEPGGAPTARDVLADQLEDFPGPVLFGFPSGHTTTPLVSLPFGVQTRVVATPAPALVFEEAAAAE